VKHLSDSCILTSLQMTSRGPLTPTRCVCVADRHTHTHTHTHTPRPHCYILIHPVNSCPNNNNNTHGGLWPWKHSAASASRGPPPRDTAHLDTRPAARWPRPCQTGERQRERERERERGGEGVHNMAHLIIHLGCTEYLFIIYFLWTPKKERKKSNSPDQWEIFVFQSCSFCSTCTYVYTAYKGSAMPPLHEREERAPA